MNRLIKLDKKALIKRLDKEFSLYMRTKDCFQGGYDERAYKLKSFRFYEKESISLDKKIIDIESDN